MAAKELKWDLESANDFRRAEILFRAHKIRVEVLESAGIPRAVMITPWKFKRDELMGIVRQLEDIIIDGERISTHAATRAASIGMNTGTFTEEAKFQRRAHQVWIVTLGGHETRAEDVKQIWDLLRNSHFQLPKVIDQIEALDKGMAGLMEPQNRFSRNEMVEMCQLFPDLK